MESLAKKAVDLTRKAKRHKKSLSGDNFYGNKLVELRADAVNAFHNLSAESLGDTAALAELIESVFSVQTPRKERLTAFQELSFSLRTTWKQPQPTGHKNEIDLFPLSILAQAKRSYLIGVGRQMNECYKQKWYDACAVMMRRLVEICIIESFEHKGIAHKIKDGNDNYLQLSELIVRALAEPLLSLSRNTKKILPQLRDVGHMSAHGRYYNAKKEDIEKVQSGCRVVIEEFLHHAGLL